VVSTTTAPLPKFVSTIGAEMLETASGAVSLSAMRINTPALVAAITMPSQTAEACDGGALDPVDSVLIRYEALEAYLDIGGVNLENGRQNAEVDVAQPDRQLPHSANQSQVRERIVSAPVASPILMSE